MNAATMTRFVSLPLRFLLPWTGVFGIAFWGGAIYGLTDQGQLFMIARRSRLLGRRLLDLRPRSGPRRHDLPREVTCAAERRWIVDQGRAKLIGRNRVRYA